jgi:hypothetical protein
LARSAAINRSSCEREPASSTAELRSKFTTVERSRTTRMFAMRR